MPKRSPKRTSTRGCKRGQVRRSAYVKKSHKRKSYKRSSGVKVKGSSVKRTRVKSKCIKMTGKHGLRVIPKLKKGELVQFGYSSSNSKVSRHRALAKALKHYNALSVFRKINVLYIFNKNKNPTLARKFKSDRDWVRERYM